MYNVKVLKANDIFKYLVGGILAVFVIILSTRYFFDRKSSKQVQINVDTSQKKSWFIGNSFLSCLDKAMPVVANVNEEYNKIEKENIRDNVQNINYLQEMLKTEIGSIKGIENIEKVSKKDDVSDLSDNNDDSAQVLNEQNGVDNEGDKEIKLVDVSGVKTEISTKNPIADNFNVKYGNVKIKNQTSYNLTDEVLKPDIKIDNKNILIFHTHSCESYTPSEKFPYNQTGNFRSTDLNFTVTRVGSELESYLKQYSLNVVHNTSYHDYPSYNGSYTRSLETVQGIKQQTPFDVIIDLHRDAIGSRPDYAPTVKIDGMECAQIMFVIRY